MEDTNRDIGYIRFNNAANRVIVSHSGQPVDKLAGGSLAVRCVFGGSAQQTPASPISTCRGKSLLASELKHRSKQVVHMLSPIMLSLTLFEINGYRVSGKLIHNAPGIITTAAIYLVWI